MTWVAEAITDGGKLGAASFNLPIYSSERVCNRVVTNSVSTIGTILAELGGKPTDRMPALKKNSALPVEHRLIVPLTIVRSEEQPKQSHPYRQSRRQILASLRSLVRQAAQS